MLTTMCLESWMGLGLLWMWKVPSIDLPCMQLLPNTKVKNCYNGFMNAITAPSGSQNPKEMQKSFPSMQTRGFFVLNFLVFCPKNWRNIWNPFSAKDCQIKNWKDQNKKSKSKTKQKQITPKFLHSVKLFALAREPTKRTILCMHV